jgi:hypothetical protein
VAGHGFGDLPNRKPLNGRLGGCPGGQEIKALLGWDINWRFFLLKKPD